MCARSLGLLWKAPFCVCNSIAAENWRTLNRFTFNQLRETEGSEEGGQRKKTKLEKSHGRPIVGVSWPGMICWRWCNAALCLSFWVCRISSIGSMVRKNYVRSMQAEMRDRLQSNYICTYVRLGPSLDKGLSLRRRNATINATAPIESENLSGDRRWGDEASAKAQAGARCQGIRSPAKPARNFVTAKQEKCQHDEMWPTLILARSDFAFRVSPWSSASITGKAFGGGCSCMHTFQKRNVWVASLA